MPKEQHSEQEIISALKQYESGERKAVTLLRLKVERIDLGGSKIAKQQGHVVRSQSTPPRSKVRVSGQATYFFDLSVANSDPLEQSLLSFGVVVDILAVSGPIWSAHMLGLCQYPGLFLQVV